MNLRDLEYFVAVADLGHFGNAAARCFVSQPTLSGQIKKLEAGLGVKLFERSNRRVLLTDAGRQILEPARRILGERARIREIAGSFIDPLSGRFRLGAFPTLATYVFPDLVPAAQARMPELRLILIEEKTEGLLGRLRGGGLDAALIALPVAEGFLEAAPLFTDEFDLAVPADHPLAARTSVSQADLSGRRLLLLEEGHCLRDQALEVCHRHDIGEDPDFRSTSLETLRLMVRGGTGITFMPRVARRPDPGIRYVPFEAPVPRREIGLVWRKTTARRAVIDRLIELLRRT